MDVQSQSGFNMLDTRGYDKIINSIPVNWLPGKFKLSNLWGTSPGAATYLMETYVDADGRQGYKDVLLSILAKLQEIEGSFYDNGRLMKIKREITITLNFINTIKACKGESWQD